MKKRRIILLAVGLFAFLALSWLTVIGAETPEEQQQKLVEKAKAYMEDEIYVYAIPALEEAASIHAPLKAEAEDLLKKSYLSLNTYQSVRKYLELLDVRMNREDAPASVFMEAATYYLNDKDYSEFFRVVKKGIEKTDDSELKTLYEAYRYRYHLEGNQYDEVRPYVRGTAKVRIGEKWGVVGKKGETIIPCQYDFTTNFVRDRAIVRVDSTVFAINSDGHRIALLKIPCSDLGVYSDERLPVKTDGGWVCATSQLYTSEAVFEELKAFRNGVAAAKQNGKWGLLNADLTWLVEPVYEGLKWDENGFAYHGGLYFVKNGSSYDLYREGDKRSGTYEDAVPFAEGNFAAVRKNGKWGYIDRDGNVVIDYIFDEALSFSGHVAAARVGDKWGYIGEKGVFEVEPVFEKAYSMFEGCAPVLTENGWRFLVFLEYSDR